MRLLSRGARACRERSAVNRSALITTDGLESVPVVDYPRKDSFDAVTPAAVPPETEATRAESRLTTGARAISGRLASPKVSRPSERIGVGYL